MKTKIVRNPNRSPVFRLITIASSGLGSFVIGMWGLKVGFGNSVGGMPTDVVGSYHRRAVRTGRGRRGAVLLRRRRQVGGLCPPGDPLRQADRAACAHRHGRQDRASRGEGTIKSGEPSFLVDIDIDRFKQINNSIGYSKGDELIRAFAQRLQASLPPRARSSGASAPARSA